MPSIPFPSPTDHSEAELAALYARLAAIDRVIADLERYAAITAQIPVRRPVSVAAPLAGRKAC